MPRLQARAPRRHRIHLDADAHVLPISSVGLSTKHKSYSVVLGLAGAALLTDKLFLRPDSGPAHTQATSVSSSPDAAGATGKSAQSLRARGDAGNSELADRLRIAGAMLPRTPVSDAFLLPMAWRDTPNQETPISNDVRTSDEPAEITAARAELKLTGVVMGTQPVAVIDGLPYRPGEKIAGLVLSEVTARAAHLKHEATGVMLELRLADRPSNERSMRVSPRGNEGTPEKPLGDGAVVPQIP
jgi:hypothetical protein